MKVRILTRLKNGPQIIDEGAVFEGEKKDLPDFVLFELKQNRGTIEILSEAKPKKKRAARKVNAIPATKAEAKGPQSEKPATLREKLAKVEE